MNKLLPEPVKASAPRPLRKGITVSDPVKSAMKMRARLSRSPVKESQQQTA
jgi:hypothetical protein